MSAEDEDEIDRIHARLTSDAGRKDLIDDIKRLGSTWYTRAFLMENGEASDVAAVLGELARALAGGEQSERARAWFDEAARKAKPKHNVLRGDAKRWLLKMTKNEVKGGIFPGTERSAEAVASAWVNSILRALPEYRDALRALMPKLEIPENADTLDGIRVPQALVSSFERVMEHASPSSQDDTAEALVRAGLRALGCTEADPLSFLAQEFKRKSQ